MTQHRKINIWNQTSILAICMFQKFGMTSILVIRSQRVQPAVFSELSECLNLSIKLNNTCIKFVSLQTFSNDIFCQKWVCKSYLQFSLHMSWPKLMDASKYFLQTIALDLRSSWKNRTFSGNLSKSPEKGFLPDKIMMSHSLT